MKMTMATFLMVVLAIAGRAVWAHEDHEKDSGKETSKRDQLRIAVQEICPISGEKLGSMGDPIKVSVGKAKEEIFVCCKECLKGKVEAKHWATIHANMAKAQGVCPIMKKAIPEKAKWTIVEGQIVYVCCPPCIKKIQSEPEAALTKVDEYYSAYLEEKAKETKKKESEKKS